MSRENVEAFERAMAAYNRRDLEAWVEELDPEIEFRSAFNQMLGGGAGIYRGHDGARDLARDLDETFAQLQIEILETRDLGERVLGISRLYGRGRTSGADVGSPFGWVVEFRNGRALRVQSYFDPNEALEAAGVPE